MRSSYYFLPRDQKCFEQPDGTPLPVDFYDPLSFSKFGLSPVVSSVAALNSDPDHTTTTTGGGGGGGVEGLVPNLGEEGVGEGKGETEVPKRSEPVEAEGEVAVSVPSTFTYEPTEENINIGTTTRGSDMRRSSSSSSSSSSPSDDDSPPTPPNLATNAPPMLNKVQSSSTALISEYLERTLRRASEVRPSRSLLPLPLPSTLSLNPLSPTQFHQFLETSHSPTKSYPPFSLLISQRTPTVRGVMSTSHNTIASSPYSHLLWGEGDGIVLHSSASVLPGGWGKEVKGVVESGFGHVSLLGDLEGVRKALRLLE